jgi:hypothetical protein
MVGNAELILGAMIPLGSSSPPGIANDVFDYDSMKSTIRVFLHYDTLFRMALYEASFSSY